MDKRLFKKVLIFSVFFIIVALPVYFAFFSGPAEPLPTPAPAIAPPSILSEKLFKVEESDYDFLVEIRNPNIDFGALSLIYEFRLFDADGREIFGKRDTTFLLPGQTRYEIISPIRTEKEAVDFNFRIIGADWQKLNEFVLPGLLSVKNPAYSEVKPPEQGFSKMIGSVFNDSNFDFEKVDIHVILFDNRNTPIAVNKTDIRTFLSKTERFFEVKWSKPFDGLVRRSEVNAYTNVLNNKNFIKEHGAQEKFQKFY